MRQVRRILQGTCLLLVFLIAATWMVAIWFPVAETKSELTLNQPNSNTDDSTEPPKQSLTRADFAQVWQKQLRRAVRPEPEVTKIVPTPPPPARLPWQIEYLGPVETVDREGEQLAILGIFQLRPNQTEIRGIGELVGPQAPAAGAEITAINPEQVTLQFQGREFFLPLADDSSDQPVIAIQEEP